MTRDSTKTEVCLRERTINRQPRTALRGMLALGGPNALAATKRMLREPKPADLGESFADMLELSAPFFASAEGQEGITAFMQKRKPNWVPTEEGRAPHGDGTDR